MRKHGVESIMTRGPRVERGDFIFGKIEFGNDSGCKPIKFEGYVVKTFWNYRKKEWYVTVRRWKKMGIPSDYPLSGENITVNVDIERSEVT